MRNTARPFQHWHPGTAAADLSRTLFAGALVVFDGLPEVDRLVRRTHDILEGVFTSAHPAVAERELSAEEFRRRALRARRLVDHDDAIGVHWEATLAAIGYRPETTWTDRIRLRVVPSRTDIDHARLQTLPPHRDTWGSGIQAQVNWWLPLHPLAPTRTMMIWPDLLRRPVANGSAAWSFDEFRQDRQGGYPLLPTARGRPDGPGVPVAVEPGQLLAFSAAHLHAGASDASGRTRFSIDSRSVWEPDRRAGRGAPNVDCEAPTEMWRWYRAPGPGRASPRPPIPVPEQRA